MKKYKTGVAYSGTMATPSLIKICQLVQNVMGGVGGTNGWTGII